MTQPIDILNAEYQDKRFKRLLEASAALVKAMDDQRMFPYAPNYRAKVNNAKNKLADIVKEGLQQVNSKQGVIAP